MKHNHKGRVINIDWIDWNYCFIYQRKQKTNITNTDETLKTVASNITEFRIWVNLIWNEMLLLKYLMKMEIEYTPLYIMPQTEV